MKDLINFAGYAIAAVAMVVVLSAVAIHQDARGGLLAFLAVLAVVVIPVIVGIYMAKRERRKQNAQSKSD